MDFLSWIEQMQARNRSRQQSQQQQVPLSQTPAVRGLIQASQQERQQREQPAGSAWQQTTFPSATVGMPTASVGMSPSLGAAQAIGGGPMMQGLFARPSVQTPQPQPNWQMLDQHSRSPAVAQAQRLQAVAEPQNQQVEPWQQTTFPSATVGMSPRNLTLTGGRPTAVDVPNPAGFAPVQSGNPSFMSIPDRTPEQRLADLAGNFTNDYFAAPGVTYTSGQFGGGMTDVPSRLFPTGGANRRAEAASGLARLQAARDQLANNLQVEEIRNRGQGQLRPDVFATLYTDILPEVRAQLAPDTPQEIVHRETLGEIARRTGGMSPQQSAQPTQQQNSPPSAPAAVTTQLRNIQGTPTQRLAALIAANPNMAPAQIQDTIDALRTMFPSEMQQAGEGSGWERVFPWNDPFRGLFTTVQTPAQRAAALIRRDAIGRGVTNYGQSPDRALLWGE